MWLWSSQAVSVIGGALSAFAFNIYLTQTRYPLPEQKPELAAALSLTALAFMATAIFGAPIAGAVADRFDRRRIMLTCDVIGGLTSIGCAALLALSTPPLWLLIALMAIIGLTSTFHGSAFDTSYATLVPRERLPRANGMMQTIWSLSGLAAPALAASIIALPALARHGGGPAWLAGLRDGVPLALVIDGVTFLLAALVLTRLAIPRPNVAAGPAAPHTTPARRTLRDDVRLGWTFILQRPPLLHLLLTFAGINLLTNGLGVLEPLLVKFTLKPDWQARDLSFEQAFAALTIAHSAGGVLGGLLISTWGGLRRARVLGVLIPMILSGAALFGVGTGSTLPLTATFAVLMGLMLPAMNAHSQSIWQSRVPAHLQGRVFSVRRLIAQFTAPISSALAGILAARYAPGGIIAVSGALIVLLSAAQLLNPALRHVEDADDPALQPA